MPIQFKHLGDLPDFHKPGLEIEPNRELVFQQHLEIDPFERAPLGRRFIAANGQFDFLMVYIIIG